MEHFEFDNKRGKINDKQKLFCMEYVKNRFNGTNAAISAGYSKKTAAVAAAKMLIIPNIAAYIQALKADISTAIGVSAIDIANEYAKIGFSDIRQIFDEDGNMIKIKQMSDSSAASIASIEVLEEFDGVGPEKKYIGNTKKVRFYDKVTALDKLAKMLGVDGTTKTLQTNIDGGTTIVELKPDVINEEIS